MRERKRRGNSSEKGHRYRGSDMIIMILGRKKKNEKEKKMVKVTTMDFPCHCTKKKRARDWTRQLCPLMEKLWPYGTR